MEVVFTSGGSEADAIAVAGVAGARPDGGGRLVISAIEHDAVRLTARDVAARTGLTLTEVGVRPSGALDVNELAAALDGGAALVSCMWANNETGVIQPVGEVAARASAAGAVVHSDAVQAVGRVPVDFSASGLDALSFTGHKIGGPVGTGALVLKTGVPVRDIRPGGGQDRQDGHTGSCSQAGGAVAIRRVAPWADGAEVLNAAE